jgi:hypothetical protein
MSGCCRFSALVLAILLPSVAQGFSFSRPPPAYCFKPGDRLVYELRSESTLLTTGAVAERCFGQVEIWCLALEDGGVIILWRVLKARGVN